MSDRGETEPRRWQVGLFDLTLRVLAAGMATGVVRAAKGLAVDDGLRPMRVVGSALMALGIVLVLPLLRQAVLMGRRRAVAPMVILWAIAWRLAAVALVLAFVAEQTRWSRLNEADCARIAAARCIQPISGNTIAAHLNLYPICGVLLLVGLALALGAAPTRPGRERGRLVYVPLAGLVAILLVDRHAWIPYMVATALEAVTCALVHAVTGGPALRDRIVAAGGHAALAGSTILITALWVSRDLGCPAPDRLTWRSMLPRLISLAVTVGAGACLLLVTISMVHVNLSVGLWMTIGRPEVAAIVAGFTALAAGLAARAMAAAPGPGERDPRLRRILHIALPLLALPLAVLSALSFARATRANGAFGESPSTGLLDALAEADSWLCEQSPLFSDLGPLFEPDRLLLTLALVWLAGQVALLVVVRPSDRPVPLDSAAESATRLGWFLWLTSALTAACLATLPALFVGSLALYHARTMGWLPGLGGS